MTMIDVLLIILEVNFTWALLKFERSLLNFRLLLRSAKINVALMERIVTETGTVTGKGRTVTE